ncbi:hypothetical protein GZ77_16755 [Endozoicomonas montiporae]|uniref:Uncharacterized protein n=1 Tax=Endozoicomonas montiporae TaxID=1027273 RepID=A0A081N627_9GAMM|nr:hypothetical protein GZ77_16755 [Endozoicomonas montiporae]
MNDCSGWTEFYSGWPDRTRLTGQLASFHSCVNAFFRSFLLVQGWVLCLRTMILVRLSSIVIETISSTFYLRCLLLSAFLISLWKK